MTEATSRVEPLADAVPPVLPDVQFTPFVGELRSAAERGIRAMLGLPPSVPVAWKYRSSADWHLHVMVGDGEDRLELDFHPPVTPGWVSGTRFSVAYRQFRGGGDPAADPTVAPLLRHLRARLRAVDRGCEWSSVQSALVEESRFGAIKDRMLRMVSPEEAYIRLGFRCNQRCDFCWQDRSWPEPPLEYYHRWLDEIAAAGRPRVTFTGGEATIHTELIPLVQRARSHGLDVTLQTNAVQLAKEGYARRLREAGVQTLFVSFHSHLPEVSDAMTSAPRTHARTCQGIVAALREGFIVQLNCVVDRRNAAHLAEHAAFIVERFVTPFSENPARIVVYSHPCSYYDREVWEANLAPLDLVKPNLVAAMRVLDAAGVLVSGVGTCGFPPCLLKDQPEALRRICRADQAEGDVEGRVFAPVCEGCSFRQHCLGVRSEYFARFGDRGLDPLTEVPDVSGTIASFHAHGG